MDVCDPGGYSFDLVLMLVILVVILVVWRGFYLILRVHGEEHGKCVDRGF